MKKYSFLKSLLIVAARHVHRHAKHASCNQAHSEHKGLLIISAHLTSYCAAGGLVKDYNYHFAVCIVFISSCLQYCITLSISPSLSLPLSLSYTRPKVQAHHLLIRQKECNEIINVLELIMNMIKKAKISGAGISLPIQSQGLLSFRERQKKPSTRPGSSSPLLEPLHGAPLYPATLSLIYSLPIAALACAAPSCRSQMRSTTVCTPRGPDLPPQIPAPHWR